MMRDDPQAERRERSGHGADGRTVRILRRLVAVGLALAVGWWLFADTYRHYTRRGGPLRVSCWGNYQNFMIWQDVCRQFEDRHPGANVALEYTPGSTQYMQRLQANAVAGNLPDIMQMDDDFFPKLAAELPLEDLRPWAERDPDVSLDGYDPHGLGIFNVDGKQTGMPLWGFTVLIVANPASFRRAGMDLPDDRSWTIRDFYRICRQVSGTFPDKRGKPIRQFACFMPVWHYWAPILWGEGARVLDPSRRHWTLYGPDAERALTRYQQMVWEWHAAPSSLDVVPGNDVAFFSGQVAMWFTGCWSLPFLQSAARHGKLDYVILHAPLNDAGRRVTRETWDGVSMSAYSGKSKLAWEFITFMTGPEGAELVLAAKQNIPAWRAAQTRFGERDEAHKTYKFVESLAYARPTPITPSFMKMMRELLDVFSRMMRREPPDPGNWDKPTRRLTPKELIQLLLSRHGKVANLFPPEDPAVVTDVPVD